LTEFPDRVAAPRGSLPIRDPAPDTSRRDAAAATLTERPLPLVARTVPVAAIDPIDLFAAARTHNLEAVLWLQPAADRSLVGIGRAWAVETGGPDRFSRVNTAWRALLADADISGGAPGLSAAGPTLLGGLGFSGREPAADDCWAPFGPASLVLPALGVARHGASAALTLSVGPDQPDDVDPSRLEREWHAIAARATGAAPTAAMTTPSTLRVLDSTPDRPAWDRTVGLFAHAVAGGRIDKVVLARRVVFRAGADLDVVAALRHLAETAPESTTFAFARDGVTFLGATPERFLRTTGLSFDTVAMAGSAPRGRDAGEDARLAAALLASAKDRAEHAVVVATLRESLTPIVDALTVADHPAILPLSHVQHLITPISGRLSDEADLLALARELHPTPAVGGAPRDAALALITGHEGFERGWYAGPIGWLGAGGDGELMVALRCGLVSGAEATLFAGCGIVAESDSATEWEESRLKLRTMLVALGGNGDEG
jgi:isochorismate synthase